jgi:hypothetical protein
MDLAVAAKWGWNVAIDDQFVVEIPDILSS